MPFHKSMAVGTKMIYKYLVYILFSAAHKLYNANSKECNGKKHVKTKHISEVNFHRITDMLYILRSLLSWNFVRKTNSEVVQSASGAVYRSYSLSFAYAMSPGKNGT